MATVEKISIALTPEIATMIRSAVATGEYATTSEVVRDALRTWRAERDRRSMAIDALRNLWRQGVASGPSQPLEAEDLKLRGRARLEALLSKGR